MDYPVIFPNKGDYVIDIPFPYTQFTDTEFFLTETSQGSNSLFIPNDVYDRIDDYRIRFSKNNSLGINENSNIRFTFIHQKNKRWIGKTEFHLTINEFGQRILYLPNSPYSQLVNIKKRVYVFYNRKRQTQGIDYLLESDTGRITLINKKLKSLIGDRVDILIIHTGYGNNGAIQELPQSGYIYLNPKEIDRNYNNNLMCVFINGQLVNRDDIIQMTNTIYKISKDIGSRYNVEIRNLSPKLNSMVPYYKQHSFDKYKETQYLDKYIFARIEVEHEIPSHNRRYIKPLFNPVYFSPELTDNPNLWINFILKKSNTNYTLKLYGDDHIEEPSPINVVLQLRDRTKRDFRKNSKSSILATILPTSISSLDRDYVLFSIQIKTILNMDKTNTNYDGIIGRLQANIREYDELDPIYYTLESDSFDNLTDVSVFRWTVTTQEENTGYTLWSKELDFEPDNKIPLLEGS